MKVYDRLRNAFINSDYYISFSKNYFYIINYKEIISFDDRNIKVRFSNFTLIVNGINFKVKRKNNYELEVSGEVSKMEILNEE